MLGTEGFGAVLGRLRPIGWSQGLAGQPFQLHPWALDLMAQWDLVSKNNVESDWERHSTMTFGLHMYSHTCAHTCEHIPDWLKCLRNSEEEKTCLWYSKVLSGSSSFSSVLSEKIQLLDYVQSEHYTVHHCCLGSMSGYHSWFQRLRTSL